MLTDIVIRKAAADDVESLIGLLGELFAIETDFTFHSERQRQGLVMLLDREKDCCLLVAETTNKQVIGMCSAQLLVSTAEGGLKALVEDMVIAEPYRGQGIGKDLLSTVEKWAAEQGAKRLDLLADHRNRLALTFYDNMNWSRTELIALQKKLKQS